MDALQEWVDHHMRNKTTDELWFLSAEILEELSKRDSIRYRVNVCDSHRDPEREEFIENTHDSEGC